MPSCSRNSPSHATAAVNRSQTPLIPWSKTDDFARSTASNADGAIQPNSSPGREVSGDKQGSVDLAIYQAQMVTAKARCTDLAIDHEGEADDFEFLHLDTILARFVKDMAKLLAVDPKDLRNELRRLAVA